MGGQQSAPRPKRPVTYAVRKATNLPPPLVRLVIAFSDATLRGRMYVLGGGVPTCGHMSSVEAYDPRANRWLQLPDLHEPRFGLCAVILNDRLYALGGIVKTPGEKAVPPQSPTASVECYDPQTGAWTGVAPMLSTRHGFSAAVHLTRAVAGGNRIVVCGGSDALSPDALNSCEVYDPRRDVWSPLQLPPLFGAHELGLGTTVATPAGHASLPPGSVTLLDRRAHFVSAVIGHKWYMCGGVTGATKHVRSECEVFDFQPTASSILPVASPDPKSVDSKAADNAAPATGPVGGYGWTRIAPMSVPRAFFAGAVLDGRLFVTGGHNSMYGCTSEVYDPATNRWSPLGLLCRHHERHAAAAVGGTLYLSGGRVAGMDVRARAMVEKWNPINSARNGRGKWEERVIADMTFARASHAMCASPQPSPEMLASGALDGFDIDAVDLPYRAFTIPPPPSEGPELTPGVAPDAPAPTAAASAEAAAGTAASATAAVAPPKASA